MSSVVKTASRNRIHARVCISAIGRLLLALPLIRTVTFVDQDVLLLHGYAFWVDLSRSSILFAPCPLLAFDDEQRSRIVAGLFRIVNDRLTARPRLSQWLFTRILIVRRIDLNGGVRLRFAREARIDWSMVEHFATDDG